MNQLLILVLLCALATSQAQYGEYPGPLSGLGGPEPVPSAAAPAPVGRDGRVIDTPEVQAAKAAHFEEFARAAARAAAEEDKAKLEGPGPSGLSTYEQPSGPAPSAAYQSVYAGPKYQTAYPQPQQPSYQPQYQPAYQQPQQPQYQPQYQPSFQAPQYQQHRLSLPQIQIKPRPQPQPAYYETKGYGALPAGAKAPFAPAPLAEDGTVLDTPEVAALKNARLQELADAAARAYSQGNEEYTEEQGQYPGPQQYQPSAVPQSIPRTAYPGAPRPSASFAPQPSYQAAAYPQPQPQPSYQPSYPRQY